MNTYLEGLRHRLKARNVKVVTIKPGFVDTPMTAGMKKNFLYASPAAVAGDMRSAIQRGKAETYTPWFWRWILLVVKALPRPIFYRTRL
jgi:decaprenylphospho-beta-D-erythro-pentofuranosid-2-ulose 2-reductase